MDFKKLAVGLLCALMVSPILAQDDLLDMLDEEETTDYASATFKGTLVVNGQSIETPAEGVMQFMISHRFGPVNDDFIYRFFGLDDAQIRLGLDYGIFDWLNVGAGRSNFEKMYDGFVKARILRQSTGAVNMPVTMVWHSSMNIRTERPVDNLPYNTTDRFAYVHQLIIARKFSDRFSLQVAPTLVHFNIVDTRQQRNDNFGVLFASRFKLSKRVALTAEYYLQMPPHTNVFQDIETPYDNALSIGFDIETGGHVFQLHLTNTRGMAGPQWMNQTVGSWGNGDIFFGFNISRVFTLKKPKQAEAKF